MAIVILSILGHKALVTWLQVEQRLYSSNNPATYAIWISITGSNNTITRQGLPIQVRQR